MQSNASFLQLQMSPLAAVVAVLAAAAVAHVLLRWWLRRKASQTEAEPGTPLETDAARIRRWISRGLRDVVPPLALLLWVHGLYYALGMAAGEWLGGDTVGRVRTALEWIYGLAVVASLVWLLARVGRLIEAFLASVAARTAGEWDDVLLGFAGRAARRLLPVLALLLAMPVLAISPAQAQIVRNAASLVLIGMVAFVLYQLVDVASAFVLRQHRLDVADNLRARAIHTQVLVLKKVAIAVIGVFTIASMLMVFESVRQFGASILASAGVAGIIVGFAAQRSIATLLAGFQIALTQPIRVDDVVIVENEWGRIEDITLTYVVVRIWDLRRLVLPITYFIEQPFQNWTRRSADILGTVFLHVDYTVPLDALRAELTRILEASPNWDGKVNVLQVTDAKPHTLEVRALASARDASAAWDLRCEVREKLVQFLQRNFPESLPRLRATVEEVASAR
ncbi:MAG TPA: mechanosensitive ion channel domain-containing protein [Vicinamibacterales bacterium]